MRDGGLGGMPLSAGLAFNVVYAAHAASAQLASGGGGAGEFVADGCGCAFQSFVLCRRGGGMPSKVEVYSTAPGECVAVGAAPLDDPGECVAGGAAPLDDPGEFVAKEQQGWPFVMAGRCLCVNCSSQINLIASYSAGLSMRQRGH